MTGRDELENAKGFGVESDSGRIGSVVAVVPGPASTLLVYTGGRSCTLASVPFDEVADVNIGARRVVLRRAAHERGRPRQARVSGIP